MRKIKFIKEPGYAYDLLFLFTLYFNKEYVVSNFINYNKASEDTDFFNKIITDFAPISDELLPFFYLNDNKKNFISEYYYEPYKDDFTTTYDFTTIQSALTDYDSVITNLIRCYFVDISDETLKECKNSTVAIGRLIKNSNYNSDIKSSLYAFFLEPIPVIQKLSYELLSKEFLLSQRYEKNYKKSNQLQHEFDFKKFNEKFEQYKNQEICLDSFEYVYVSFCFININCAKMHFIDSIRSKLILVLGSEYDDYTDYLISDKRAPELDVFGNALSEKNRVEILDLIVRKNEITIRDTEQDLGFTGTNAYYHLSLMIKANMIKVRNQGRTMFYSINRHYFDMVGDILSKYSNDKKGDGVV